MSRGGTGRPQLRRQMTRKFTSKMVQDDTPMSREGSAIKLTEGGALVMKKAVSSFKPMTP